VENILSTYSINYKGLKFGKHSFDFDINNEFFNEFEAGEIEQGALKVLVLLNKMNNILEMEISIDGTVRVQCDRCLEMFDLPLHFKGKLFGKIGNEDSENTDEIIYLTEDDYKIDLAQYLYESIYLSLPLIKYHGINGTSKQNCNPDMISRIGVNESNDDSIDPRWEKLKDLKKN